MTAETQDGRTLAYAYDPAGRLASLTLPSGEQIAYAYDADGALTEVSDWNSGRHTFGYDAAGALETVRAANGVTTRVEYSPLGLPEAVHLTRPDDTPLADIRLRCNANDALLEAHDSALGHARFEYDPAGRLVRASGAFAEAFAYDPAGNLTQSETPSGQDDYEYDRANRLLGGPFLQCRHDRDGHVTSLASPEGRLSLTYNAFGLLTHADLPGGGTAEYGYDALGRRTVKRVGNEETRFLWAGDLLVGETITCDNTVTETHDFLFPPGSWSPLAQRISGTVFCCHTDHRGAPTRLTDSSGHLAWSAAYTAFGQAHPRHALLRQPLRLPGQYHDEETGLHQNRWRSYDPQRGRYLSPDPLELAGGLNLYAYAGSDPINGSDPRGLFPGIEDLAPRVLGAKTGSQASQAYSQVQNLLHHHLSGMTPPFMSNGPSPFNLGGMSIPGFSPQSLGLPGLHLPNLPTLGNLLSLGNLGGGSGFTPGINGFLPGGSMPGGLLPGPQHNNHYNNAHQAKHRTPLVPQAPPPAKAAHACTQKLKAMPPLRRRRRPPLPPPPPPPEEEHGFVDFTKNLLGFGKHHGGIYKAVTAMTGVGGPNGHGGIATVATNVVHDNWTFEKNAAADVYELSQGHPAAALQHRQAALAAFNRNIEVTKNLIPFGGSHGLIAQYGEVVFDNAYGLDDDAAQAITKADADLSDQAYNDPVNFAMNFIPIAAEGRVLLLGRLTEVERAARLAGNTARAEKAAVAIARVQRVDAAMRGGKLGTQTRAQAAALTRRLMAKAQARRLAGVRDHNNPYAPHTPKSLAQGQKAAAALQRRRYSQTHGGPPRNGQPTLASVSGGNKGRYTSPIGRPEPTRMADRKGPSGGTGGGRFGRKSRKTGASGSVPIGGSEAVRAELHTGVAGFRAKIRGAGFTDKPNGKGFGNLAAAKVVMKDGTEKTFYSFSNMGDLKKIKSPLVSDFVPDTRPYRIQSVMRGGYQYHTEPRLLNYILNTQKIDDISEIHMLTERSPCPQSCGPFVIKSWRTGSWEPGKWAPTSESKVTPETQNIPLWVYDGDGYRW